MSYGVKTFKLICPVCKDAGKPDPTFLTSRKNAKACLLHREEWYRRYHHGRYSGSLSRVATQSRIARSRKPWYVKEHVCDVTGCGYSNLTRKLKSAKDGSQVEIFLCPKHLFEYRCGFIEEWTWVERDMEIPIPKEQQIEDHTAMDTGKGNPDVK